MSSQACLSASRCRTRLAHRLLATRNASLVSTASASRRTSQIHARFGIFTALAGSIALALPSDTQNALCDKLKRLQGSLEHYTLVKKQDREQRSASNLRATDTKAVDKFRTPTTIANETLIVCGNDRRGRPILIARPAMHIATTEMESLKAVRQCVQTVRRSLELMPAGEQNLLVLYDLFGASYKNFDMTFSRALLDELNTEFSDKLGQVLIVNGHWSMRAAWNTIRVLLHPETRQKVVFVGSAMQQLDELIHPDHPYMQRLRAEKPTV